MVSTYPISAVPVIDEGQGRAIVFLHGAPDHRYEWQQTVQLLRDHYRCLAPDLPGFGHSEAPPAAYDFSIAAQVAFFDAWIDHTLGNEPFLLVMHDIGAIMGMAWAALHPERVEGLIVMNTVLHADYRWHTLARVWSTPILGDLFMLGMNRGLYKAGFKRDFPAIQEIHIDSMYDGMTRVARQSILRHFRKMTQPDFFMGWEAHFSAATQNIPTTVLWGAQDPLIPASYAQRIGGTLNMLPDCGHWVPLEQPKRIAEEVRVLTSARSPVKQPSPARS